MQILFIKLFSVKENEWLDCPELLLSPQMVRQFSRRRYACLSTRSIILPPMDSGLTLRGPVSHRSHPESSSYPLQPPPPATCASQFSVREFFKDSPWLNVPTHRKAEILIEPLYPRLGLLGGAPEASGKMSKLAALAAARKKREAQANGPGSQSVSPPSEEEKSRSISLLDRLSAGKPQISPQEPRTPKLSLRKDRSAPSVPLASPTSPPVEATPEPEAQIPDKGPPDVEPDTKPHRVQVDLRADPSIFATTIVGQWNKEMASSPHCSSRKIDMRVVFGQDLTDTFNFAEPSPDDAVLNAQNAAKGMFPG